MTCRTKIDSFDITNEICRPLSSNKGKISLSLNSGLQQSSRWRRPDEKKQNQTAVYRGVFNGREHDKKQAVCAYVMIIYGMCHALGDGVRLGIQQGCGTQKISNCVKTKDVRRIR